MVVISHYDQRPVEPLLDLLQSLINHPSGGAYDVCVVVNDTQGERGEARGFGSASIVMHRPNTGMNIGAWDHAWRHNPGYRDYLFLQDECYAVAPHWLAAFRDRYAQAGAGLLGESMNPAWDSPWDQLRETQGQTTMPEHMLEGKPANRVDVYVDFIRRQGIDPGPNGLHLRSLVWYASGEMMASINGFPLGANYGECIAAEIAVSRKVVSTGNGVAQVADRPFSFFRHREWKEKFPGGPFRHFRT